MKRALYAGSFDPPTSGHLWIVNEAFSLFGEVVVAIADNPAKRRTVPVTAAAEILSASVPFGVRVIRCPPDRYVADLAEQEGCDYLIRGLRGAEDLPHEQALRDFAEERAGLVTVVLMPPPHLRGLSSSYVRALVGPIGWEDIVANLVPEATLEYMKGAKP